MIESPKSGGMALFWKDTDFPRREIGRTAMERQREARLQRGNREVDVRAMILLVLCIIHILCSLRACPRKGQVGA